MWSIGCIVYFMLTQKPPFHAKTEKEIESLSVKAKFSFPEDMDISERGIEDLSIHFPAQNFTF